MFTCRPELLGSFGMVSSTHWLASSAGMSILEKGGNAFDAAFAAGMVLQVAEPHLNGPGGDLPLIIYSAKNKKTKVICGQGSAPAKANIEFYKSQGLNLIPSNGLLSTVIPGAFDAWMLMLRDYGTMNLREVFEPALNYAKKGIPMLPNIRNAILENKVLFLKEWISSANLYIPKGKILNNFEFLVNESLFDTWLKIIKETEKKKGSRENKIDAGRDIFYKGFV